MIRDARFHRWRHTERLMPVTEHSEDETAVEPVMSTGVGKL
jgi:hypothetical protein